MTLRTLSTALLLALSSLTLAAHADGVRRPYIIQLADKPIASYDGAIAGLPATQPPAGGRLDLQSAPAQQYNDYLGQKQATVQAAVPAARITYNYSVVLNGFAAMLTNDEVRALMARSDVASVAADTPRQVVTTYTPHFLGLDAPGGLWSKLGGTLGAGENTIIGVVDTGTWPENQSYADRVDANGKPTFDASGTLAYGAPPANWKGICQTGEGFTTADCNNKLIGAQYFDAAFRGVPQLTIHWTEFRSPRDSIGGTVGQGGHGTHTSTTAAGNNGAEAIVSGIDFGAASGMAPRARIAVYKVCWTYNDATNAAGKNSCFTGDTVAAIEKAVVDGVNVINYSISGGTTVGDAVEQAFLHASNAGVFVAAAAGNDGPDKSTVNHVSPWLATVAASTHNRQFQADVVLGNGTRYTGASLNTAAVPASPIIRSEDAAAAGADAMLVQLCYSAGSNGGVAVLDPAKVAGKIVTCVRGTNARLDKSLAVQEAGGIGMVEVDNGGGLIAEVHSVPTVHVTAADGAAIKAYAGTAGATASFTRFVNGVSPVPAPTIADFSSRGPNPYDLNVLKPDLSAPGVEIIAGFAPTLTMAQRAAVIDGTFRPPYQYAIDQGTSMATPHVAGIALLLHQSHPAWTPAMIKSALMTTGTDTFPDTEGGDVRGQLPFGQGAGHITPNSANDPGLVYNALEADYRKYMCGAGITSECAGGTITGYNLNQASIALGNVLNSVVVQRSVTNASATAATYTASGSITGYAMAINPATLTLGPGETKSFTVTLTKTGAPFNTWQYGSLTWTDGVHVVRSPVVARSGQLVNAAALIKSDKATASKVLSVATGFSGKMTTTYGGLKEVTKTASSVAQAPLGSIESLDQVKVACQAANTGVRILPFTVPSGTVLATFELFNTDTGDGNGEEDLDLAVLDSTGAVVAYSLTGGSNEAVTMPSPAPGNYRVCVLGYSVPNGVSTDFALSSDIVNATDKGGNFKVLLPASVYTGSTASVSTSWSGLATGKRYFGAIQLKDTSGNLASTTVVQVETNSPVPLPEPTGHPAIRDTGK